VNVLHVSAALIGYYRNFSFVFSSRCFSLNGLASGRSIGGTLQDLGLSESEAKDARKQADKELKDARKH